MGLCCTRWASNGMVKTVHQILREWQVLWISHNGLESAMMKWISSIQVFFIAALAGCASTSSLPATRPNTDVPAVQATPEYWFGEPASAGVESLSFRKLWDTCQTLAMDDGFEIDWMDWREGIISTKPKISKELFEFWKSDAGRVSDVFEDSIQTIRRTIHFEVTRTPEG